MKKIAILLPLTLALVGGSLASCGDSSHTISVCASEIPHAKILNEAVKPLLKSAGYDLNVTVLDWSLQNEAVASGDYDANYFQHAPYLATYDGTVPLAAACKVHFEVLCLYASNVSHKTLADGDSIELVDDPSNIERALKLLASYNVLTINAADYDASGNFTNFSITNPNSGVTFSSDYSKCSLKCIKESSLCAALPDYSFGIIPGNTAMTGLENYTSKIALSEKVDAATLDLRANLIAVKKDNLKSAKTLALVKALGDASIGTYISKTFGDSVIYHYVDLLD
ncbi:MAG: Methionine-binding lipoprotein MetQ precursor [Tenericutes bacterium ADurb.BinA155]|nr:MAG: Methionine-binding lipoprotein MetQ precursor [Tenericutes bacterium ADurb.BinA155]